MVRIDEVNTEPCGRRTREERSLQVNSRFVAGVLLVLLTTTATAEVVLVENRLTLDALALVNARWQRVSEVGVSRMDFSFYRFGAPVGLNWRPATDVMVRVSFDAGWNERALDLYADLRLPAGFVLRSGQFIPPIGREALTLPRKLRFVEYSILKGAWKPYDPRDVGLMLSRDTGLFAASIAVVNGFGRSGWLQDENRWKDVCGRVVFRPRAVENTFVGGRGYYGRVGPEGGLMANYALESGLGLGEVTLLSEVQRALIGTYAVTAAYLEASGRVLDWLEPVGRLQASIDDARTLTAGATAGAIVDLHGESVQIMLNYDYLRRFPRQHSEEYERHQLLLQLRASL